MEQAARRSNTRWRRRALQVGGDRYDTFQVSDGSTELVVGDVSGHDQEAAVMAQVRNVLRGIAPERRTTTVRRRSGPGRPSSSTPTASPNDAALPRRGGGALPDHYNEARPCRPHAVPALRRAAGRARPGPR